MKKTYGNHLPFDSDACFNWTIYCFATGHDINTPVELEEKEFDKVLGFLPNSEPNDERSVARNDAQRTERRQTKQLLNP